MPSTSLVIEGVAVCGMVGNRTGHDDDRDRLAAVLSAGPSELIGGLRRGPPERPPVIWRDGCCAGRSCAHPARLVVAPSSRRVFWYDPLGWRLPATPNPPSSAPSAPPRKTVAVLLTAGLMQNDDRRDSARDMRDRWPAERSPSANCELPKVDAMTTPIAESVRHLAHRNLGVLVPGNRE